jgi:alpha-beta hydrolase superfamily lysophospholipase
VSSSAHNNFIEELNSLQKEANAYLLVDAKHELLIEKDQTRIAILTVILDFFVEYANEN